MTLFDKTISVEELKKQKNDLFFKALKSIENFSYARAEIIHRLVAPDSNTAIIRMGANREIKRDTHEFEKETLDSWPSALIIFNNDPQIQKVAVEIEYKAFRKTKTIIDILEKNLNYALALYNLSVHFKPMFDKNEFWGVIEQYNQRITETDFLMISPNLSNITHSLKLDLASWNKITNTQETSVVLKSDKNSHLTLTEGEEPVTSLVEYASEGGGNIKIRVKGLSKTITTNDATTEISIEDMDAELDIEDVFNAHKLAQLFQGLLR